MIRTIKIELNAAFPQMPLVPFQVFHDSAAAITVLNVPRRILALSVKIKNVSGVEQTFAAVRTGSAWSVTVPGSFFTQSGTSTRGVKVVGVDELANAFTLGAADLVVMLDNGTVTPVQPPAGGDMKHSEFSDLEAPDNMTQKESNALLQTIVTRLKGSTPMLLAPLLVLASLLASAAPLSPSTDHGDINPTTKVSTVVRSIVDGAARPLPKYLHALDFDDAYTNEAAAYYRFRDAEQTIGGCSAVRSGGYLSRNFDFPFDERAEFVVKMSAGEVPTSLLGGSFRHRFASVGISQVGTNLTEEIVTSGKPSRWYKALPGATVDGINEHGVVAEINVVDGEPPASTGGDIHPLAAVRWALDNGTSAEMVATSLAARIQFPAGWSQNYHWMIADETSTYIVENGDAHAVTNGVKVLTNFRLYPTRDTTGAGQERYDLLAGGANITNAWYTRAYRPDTTPPWVSEFGGDLAALALATNYWARAPREAHRGESFGGTNWWQSVHTSVYDISNRTLRVAVQETDDWYIFAVPSAGGTDEAKVREIASEVVAPVASTVSSLESSKADQSEVDQMQEVLEHTYSMAESASYWVASAGQYKADRAESGDADEISTLDADGNPTRSGIAKMDVKSVTDTYAAVSNAAMWASNEVANIHISATDPTFSNAVKDVMEVRDVPKNLKYTITADNDRFFFTPIGAINPED